jgi:hypothetical protein
MEKRSSYQIVYNQFHFVCFKHVAEYKVQGYIPDKLHFILL